MNSLAPFLRGLGGMAMRFARTLSPEHDRAMIALTDNQFKTVMRAANGAPVERRGIFLERCAAMLRMRGQFSDADVQDVTALALAGLVQQAADVAS